jgi:DNA polymerase-3 subunit gamma/tau
LQAAEMVLVRLAYAAELPTPEEAVRSLAAPRSPAPDAAARVATAPGPALRASRGAATAQPARDPILEDALEDEIEPEARALVVPDAAKSDAGAPSPESFQAVVELAEAAREGRLLSDLIHRAHLVRFEPGRIEFRPDPQAAPDLAQKLTRFLGERTGRRWLVTVSRETGEPTLAQQKTARDAADKSRVREHPLIQAVFEVFPDAKIESVRRVPPPTAETADEDED